MVLCLCFENVRIKEQFDKINGLQEDKKISYAIIPRKQLFLLLHLFQFTGTGQTSEYCFPKWSSAL